jgi:hypothetical protein
MHSQLYTSLEADMLRRMLMSVTNVVIERIWMHSVNVAALQARQVWRQALSLKCQTQRTLVMTPLAASRTKPLLMKVTDDTRL